MKTLPDGQRPGFGLLKRRKEAQDEELPNLLPITRAKDRQRKKRIAGIDFS